MGSGWLPSAFAGSSARRAFDWSAAALPRRIRDTIVLVRKTKGSRIFAGHGSRRHVRATPRHSQSFSPPWRRRLEAHDAARNMAFRHQAISVVCWSLDHNGAPLDITGCDEDVTRIGRGIVEQDWQHARVLRP